MKPAAAVGLLAFVGIGFVFWSAQAPLLLAVHPETGSVPSNLLRLYVDFSRPMAGDDAFEHIQILDAAGRPIEDAFRELELWSRDNRRLMLYVHPGRVKTGLALGDQFGPVIEEGKSYTFRITPGMKGRNGRTSPSAFSRPFQAGRPDHEPPDVARWTLAATRERLEIDLDEWLDQAGLEEFLRVEGTPGRWIVSGRHLTFVPRQRFSPGPYRLLVDARLEDLAGNNFVKPFETQSGSTPPPLGAAGLRHPDLRGPLSGAPGSSALERFSTNPQGSTEWTGRRPGTMLYCTRARNGVRIKGIVMTQTPTWKNIHWPIASFIIGAHIIAAVGTYFYATLHGFTLSSIIIAVVFLFLTCFGISGGYHRLFAHGTYEAHPILKIFYLIFGAASFESSALKWASDHRKHHAYIDEDQDPYNIKRGFWWAHIGWILTKDPASQGISKVGDLERDPWIQFQHKYYGPVALTFGLGLPALIGWLCGDVWGGLIIGGFLRLVFFYHSTFSINSVAHIWGSQPYSDDDSARDSWFTAFLTMGEGFHNFHHTFSADYRNGVNPWEYDPTKWILNGFTVVGLAKNLIRTPEPVILKAKLRMQAKRAEADLKAHPHAAEKLRIAREKLERMLDTWNAIKAEWAEERARLKDRSEALVAKLRHDMAESRRKYHEAYAAWVEALRNPHLIGAGDLA